MSTKGWYGVPLERSDYLRLDPHVDHCTEDGFSEWLGRHQDDLLAVDLFTGAGGLSLGIQEAGWTMAAGVDFDERALETHAHNFPGLSLRRDLGDPEVRDHLVELLSQAKIDLVAGGPPCQPFSRAGRSKIRDLVRNHGRDPQDHRKQLWQAYLDIVTRVRPRAVLMENVPDMGLGDDFAVVRIIEEKFEELGYATQVRLVDAWQHGVPQHRKRLILLARNDVERFDWQPKIETAVDLQQAISDLPRFQVEAQERVGERDLPYVKPADLSEFAGRMREGAPDGVIHDHMTRRVRSDDLEIFSEHMTSKTLYSDLPEKLRRYRADNFTDKYKRLAWNELSRSITAHIAKDGYWYIHPEDHRTLTVREAARIQTFPDRFRFAGTRSDAFRQIGNAVPPLLGHAAAKVVLPIEGMPENSGLVPHWRQVRDDLSKWADSAREQEGWYQFPGDEMESPQAAVMALLAGSRMKSGEIRDIMEVVRGRKAVTSRLFEQIIEKAPTTSAKDRLSRLQPLVDDRNAWGEAKRNSVPERLGFKPAEEALYTLLLGEQDLLLITQGALRVGARVNGSTGDQVNKLTDGRVDLIRLVGAGKDSSLRMAALRVIGNAYCKVTQPGCPWCPLRKHCVGKPPADDLYSQTFIEEDGGRAAS
ncbi:DNA cytosine methyltransferase [Streptomyces sp. NBC_01321]|uniref:DNA cytosine methyltransferase n=1 Tax=Streptomyces sp. NBC_01321 TaxID=2903825 RepID=UPI002E0E9104|nr:DNA cytosine methyltransferase [Streptomyces sp. NBC_01321]